MIATGLAPVQNPAYSSASKQKTQAYPSFVKHYLTISGIGFFVSCVSGLVPLSLVLVVGDKLFVDHL